MDTNLPWQRFLGRRCRAVREARPNDFSGRCELAPHSPETDHALERGMFDVRWSTTEPPAITEQRVIDWFKSGSSGRIRRAIDAGEQIITERLNDGVFE